MTRDAIKEYANALRPRYRAATRAQKKVMLDEFCSTTGYHRKSAIRLLAQAPRPPASRGRGRPRTYQGGALLTALLVIWESSGYVCGKYLAATMAGLLQRLEQCGELLVDSELRQRLLGISGATIDRLLQPYRSRRLGQPYLRDRLPSDLQHKIAVHTFAQLRALPVGHLEIDLVLHCGMSVQGFFLTSLVGVDTLSSWTVCLAVWGKGMERVGGAVGQLQHQLPFPLLGIHSDNGGEFINDVLYRYAQQHALIFTHSRPYKKNDQPRVEQRNGSIVRRLIGYERYSSQAAYRQLARVYELVNLQTNFFRPTAKLLTSERQGAKVLKRYDAPLTPYQRLLQSGCLSAEAAYRLTQQYQQLNPLQLQRDLAEAIEQLGKLEAVDPASERAQRLRQAVQEMRPR